MAFSSSSTNENHVFFLLQVYCNGRPTKFSFVELEKKATKWHKLSRVVASCKTNIFGCLVPLAVEMPSRVNNLKFDVSDFNLL